MPYTRATPNPALRFLKSSLAFLALPVLVGVAVAASYLSAPAPPAPPLQAAPASPVLDPAKPTVAVVLGRDLTEVADVLAPYAVFQAAGAFNVVSVAETRRPVTLTGNLDVVPHYTFAQLDAQLGRGPEVIVVPYVPNIQANEALRRWVKRHGQQHSLVLGVCAGAAMVAATGLLDGRPATTHWGDIARIEQNYPAVRWVRGQRYVDDGQVISTAGILSGMDGSLHVIDRLRGQALARQAAQTLHFNAQFLDQTAIPQFQPAFQDTVLTVLNLMYRWERPTLGVALLDGVDDLTLAALYDTSPAMLAGRLVSVAPQGSVITTRFGLQLVARRTPEQWPTSSPLLMPGTDAQFTLPAWTERYPRRTALPTGNAFPFNRALTDLARRTDRPTARLAAKRLEIRTPGEALPGRDWWHSPVVRRPLALGLLSLALTWGLERRLRRRRRPQRPGPIGAPAQAEPGPGARTEERPTSLGWPGRACQDTDSPAPINPSNAQT